MRSVDLVASVSSLPEHESVRLLSVASGRPGARLRLGVDVDEEAVAEFRRLVQARVDGEPLQYLEGSVPFGPVEISVDDRVLIPRPESEQLFEHIADRLAAPSIIVDLCTGSGCMAVALAKRYPRAWVAASDISHDALAVARANAAANGVEIDLREGDLFDALDPGLRGRVDLLTANPPYVSAAEYESVPDDVKREPRLALVGGTTGDEIVRRIAVEAADWLSPDGCIAIEVSEFHARSVVDAFGEVGAEIRTDLSGRDRYVVSGVLVG